MIFIVLIFGVNSGNDCLMMRFFIVFCKVKLDFIFLCRLAM